MDGTATKPHDPLTAEFARARIDYHTLRGRVLVAYLPWLEKLVSRAMRRLPRHVSRDEVKAEALDELLETIEVWDTNRPLIPYASKRLVGRIGDWVRRTKRVQRREFSLDELLSGPDSEGSE